MVPWQYLRWCCVTVPIVTIRIYASKILWLAKDAKFPSNQKYYVHSKCNVKIFKFTLIYFYLGCNLEFWNLCFLKQNDAWLQVKLCNFCEQKNKGVQFESKLLHSLVHNCLEVEHISLQVAGSSVHLYLCLGAWESSVPKLKSHTVWGIGRGHLHHWHPDGCEILKKLSVQAVWNQGQIWNHMGLF